MVYVVVNHKVQISKTIMENNKFVCFAPVASDEVQLESSGVRSKSPMATTLH